MEPTAILPAQCADIPSILKMMEDFYAIDKYPFYKEQTLRNIEAFIASTHYGIIWVL